MKNRAVIIVLTLLTILAASAGASSPLPEYIYEDAAPSLPFAELCDGLPRIKSPESAADLFAEAIATLSETDKTDPEILCFLALFAEQCIRYGGGDPASLRTEITAAAESAGIAFPRELRTSVNIKTENEAGMELNEPDYEEIADSAAEYFYIETPFAALRLSSDFIEEEHTIAFSDLSAIPSGNYTAVFADFYGILRYYWSIPVCAFIALPLMLTGIILKKRALILAGIPVLVISVLANLAMMYNQPIAGITDYEDISEGYSIRVDGGFKALISFPLEKKDDRDLTVVDSDGNPIPCKYNPVTDTIDAYIYKSGAYKLALSAVYFTDVTKKSPEVQHAVQVLTSCGLMDGAEERRFLPDREITRAEFFSVVLRVLNLVDEEAEASFTDVMKSDWYYSVAASAEKEGILTGYNDGTFRGNIPIPKVEIVTVAANTLRKAMGYAETSADPFALYPDGAEIPEWAAADIALAYEAGVIPERSDGLFGSESVMTRADAAVVLYRIFNKIW